MCGIAGFYGLGRINPNIIQKTLKSMKHRGPDSEDHKYISSKINNTYLLHTRLRIIDLHHRSNQPFTYKNLTIVFNGEIYNYLELKNDLKKQGYKFKTNSDTEVLLKLYYAYGYKAFEKCEGMWALAIYDSRKENLIISRDRFGEKPLFFYRKRGGIYFSSEVKSLFCLSNKKFHLNDNKIRQNLYYGYKSINNDNQTFFKDIVSVQKGCYYVINSDLSLNINKFWKPEIKKNKDINFLEAKNHTLELLKKSLKMRLRTDVPLAFSLSGGIDSSLLVSLTKKKLNLNPNTFSIIDSGSKYNEKKLIDKTVNELNNNHQYIYLKKENNFLKNLDAMISNYSCPIPTISQYIQNKIIKKISKNNYKVIISGVGSDEIFTGYYHHFPLYFSELKKSSLKHNIENWKENILPFINNKNYTNAKAYLDQMMPKNHIFDFDAKYNSKLKVKLDQSLVLKKFSKNKLKDRMLNELFHEIVPPILHLDDLNSMASSVENRSPFLDSKLFEFVYSLPNKFLIGNGYQKILLRALSKNIINNDVRLNREKKGFNASLSNVFDIRDDFNLKKFFNIVEYLSEFIDIKFLKDEIKNIGNKNMDNRTNKIIYTLLNMGIFVKRFS
jgi:asparagine synthase (glutamine-hydrolysing)